MEEASWDGTMENLSHHCKVIEILSFSLVFRRTLQFFFNVKKIL